MKQIFVVFAITTVILLAVFAEAQKHADQSTIPRFCADQSGVLKRVRLILIEKEPVGAGAKRPFIIAAKLIFLVPQRQNETVDDYLSRLRRHLDKVC